MNDARSTIEVQSKRMFGSFFLSGSEFALTVDNVQEVVNAPEAYTTIPLAPVYLRGLFNLRGTVVPVIDLGELLHLPKPAGIERQKIVIVEVAGSCVGLLFDKTGEVFQSIEEERVDFEFEGVVSGVLKLDSGRRIVQILDVTRLFKLQNVPRDANRNRLGRDRSARSRGNRKQCISFIVGPAKCSLPISDIQEILKIEKLNDSALSGGFCTGTIDLRGMTVPVIDFPALLNYREVDRSELAFQGDRRIVVMKLEKELFGLMVDSVDSIISFFPDELLTFPMVEQQRGEMFVGYITGHGEPDILLLDHQKILDNSEINEITRGHSKIYQTRSQAKESEKSKGGARHTYITFRIDGSYAVPISEVKEIIDLPKQLLQPPGLRRHVRGVLNLRGDLVTIIDARTLYSRNASSEAKGTQQVLVFKKNQAYFGMVVDAVESIVSFAENDKVQLPHMLYGEDGSTMSADISEAVEIVDTNGVRRSMLILDSDSFANRATKAMTA